MPLQIWLWLFRRSLGFIQQGTGRHLQRPGDLVEDDHGGISDPALDAADVGPVQPAMVGMSDINACESDLAS